MNKYSILVPRKHGSFSERVKDLTDNLKTMLSEEAKEGRHLQYTKVFLSDAQNQYQEFVESELYQNILSHAATTIVEQPPLDGSKVSILISTSDKTENYLFHSLRLTEDETRGNSSYIQTLMLFEKYLRIIREKGLDIQTHLIRTWIYVADIDVNYSGVVKARNSIFDQYGLTLDTHFIASTGIGGYSETRSAAVAMDFITYPDIKANDIKFLQALDHLNPTHEYGVAFERGTRISLPGIQKFFISGTASIDKHGNVLYLGDVEKQTVRLLENINALLINGGASIKDANYFIIYLRDLSDYKTVNSYMTQHFPDKPHIIVSAKVCRPQWLIEMECSADKEL